MNVVPSNPSMVVPFFGPDSGGRMKGVCIVKPIFYGSVSKYLGQKREEDKHTHQWTIFLRPYDAEDMSTYVKEVHFKLNKNYANPNRVLLMPPYEISETGYEEFEVAIKIYFHDPCEEPYDVEFMLKLFPPSGTTENWEVGKELLSQSYDEMIFQDPTQLMHNYLMKKNYDPDANLDHKVYFEARKTKSLEAILEARKTVKKLISKLRK